MKQNKFLITIGAFALTLVGFLATKANKKFTDSVTSGKFRGVGVVNGGSFSGFQPDNFTITSGFKTVYLKTVGNTKLATLITQISYSQFAHTLYYLR